VSTTIYYPYSTLESVWNDYLSVVSFTASYIAPGNTISRTVISAARNTLKNGLDYVNASLLHYALHTEILNLQQGIALPVNVSLDPDVVNMVQTRINTINTVLLALDTMISVNNAPTVNLQNVANGIDGLPSIGLLEYIMTFNAETPGAMLTSANFSEVLSDQSADWAFYATAIQNAFPTGQGAAIEAFNRQSAIAERMSQLLLHFPEFSSLTSLQQQWNWMAVYPSIAMTGSLLSSNPTNGALQALNTLRYVINNTLTQLDTLIAAFKEQHLTVVHVVTAMSNDSLPNIANRVLGNFEQWTQIAQLNNIGPPYNVSAGQQLFMPPATGANTETPPNYLLNYLGVDLYYGPLGSDMLPWTGDFFTISGYNNLMFALERGILTTIGTLVYHPNYGSRVPPEVGNVETPQTAAHIGAYANSAILYDPRVNSIVAWTVSMQPNNLINYAATIQPNGFNTTSVSLNLVLQP